MYRLRYLGFVLVGIFLCATTEYAQAELGASNPTVKPWLRIDAGLNHITPNIDAKFIAFIPDKKLGINILNVETGKVIEPSGQFIGPSFFWSPDGARLFYRELITNNGKTESKIKAWDVIQNKNIDVESFSGSSGFLTFDPRDNRLLVMHGKGVKSKKLLFPDNRLAFWQSGQRRELGKWVFAQKGATFVSEAGFAIQRLKDDDSGIESFHISPDGSTAAWATRAGRLYVSKDGGTPQMLDWGRDPRWHPEKLLLVYSGGRMVGNKAADYDLKIASIGSKGSFLTATQNSEERWPVWSPDGKSIYFTIPKSGELRVMHFEPMQISKKVDSSLGDSLQ